jgi:prepilin-type N-terminal cleavage/methylation domain-containing protein
VLAREQSGADHRGFTLIEALVVLAVVGLAAALGFPELQRGYGAIETRRARGEVATGLLAARALALRTDRPVAFSSSPEQTGIIIGTAAPRVLTGQSRIVANPAQIWFYPDGSATPGQLTLTTPGSRTTYSVGRDLGRLTEKREDAARPDRPVPPDA